MCCKKDKMNEQLSGLYRSVDGVEGTEMYVPSLHSDTGRQKSVPAAV